MPYLATINVPGYLPTDDDPPVFDTVREAWGYLAETFHQAQEEADPTDRLSRVAGDFATMWNHEVTGSVYTPTPGYDGSHDLGLVYTVREVDE